MAKKLKVLNQENYKEYRKVMAQNLFSLVTIHKRNCNDENCCVSLCVLADLYSELIGRKLTKGEQKVFL